MVKRRRTQNSLLNIFQLPPEILGYIFWLSSSPEGFEKRSLQFLTVCHYWYEVALGTSSLWSFWGNTLQEWKKFYLRRPEAPLDLVLDGVKQKKPRLNTSLEKALIGRASRGTIRRVHLRCANRKLLGSILWTLAPKQGEIRKSSVESLILRNECKVPADTSKFFTKISFPRLRHLDISDCTISWDGLGLRTKFLTTLVLQFGSPSSAPTMGQLLSLLASNPSLHKLSLTGHSLPQHRNEDHSPVSLPQLKELELAGGCANISTLLKKLICPDIMDHLDLSLGYCTPEEISKDIGPYLRGHFRRRGRSLGGLGIYASFNSYGRMLFHVGNEGGHHSPTNLAAEPRAAFLSIALGPHDWAMRLFLGLISHCPQEEIVHLQMYNDSLALRGPTAMGKVYALLPNLKVLHATSIPLAVLFPEPGTDKKDAVTPQSLRRVLFEEDLLHSDWTPLTTFLSGRQLDSLRVVSPALEHLDVQPEIRSSIKELVLIRTS